MASDPINCAYCGIVFTSEWPGQKYHSPKCAAKARQKRYIARQSDVQLRRMIEELTDRVDTLERTMYGKYGKPS